MVRKATLLERLFGGLHDGADLYPAKAVNPPGVERAAAPPDRSAGHAPLAGDRGGRRVARRRKKVVLRSVGARVAYVQDGKPAVGKLEPDDVIVAVNGARVRGPEDVFARMHKTAVGDVVRFTVRRGKQSLVIPIKTVATDSGPRRPVVGVFLEPALDIHLPFNVRIDAGNVGGPSAGLAFALEVMEELGRDVVHGHRVAATGEIFPDGSVGPIGGIKQKTIGARQAHVDAFLVPAGDNARDAKKHAAGLRILPVENFSQALRALATLGPST